MLTVCVLYPVFQVIFKIKVMLCWCYKPFSRLCVRSGEGRRQGGKDRRTRGVFSVETGWVHVWSRACWPYFS